MGRNLVSMLGSQAATFVLTLIMVTLLPKRLGTNTYGALAFATAYLGYFALASSLGSNQFLVKTIARDPSQLSRYIFNALVMKVLLGTALACLAVLAAHVLGYAPQVILIIEVGGIGIVMNALADVLNAGLQATERMGKLALWFTIQQYATGVIAILLLLAHHGVVAYALVLACGASITVIANGVRLWPEISGQRRIRDASAAWAAVLAHPEAEGAGRPRPFRLRRIHTGAAEPSEPEATARGRRRHAARRLDLRLWKVIAVGGLPFVSWSLILLVYGSIDILMLHAMTGSASVAWYTLAYTWVGIPVFLPSLLVTVIYPSLSSKALGSSVEFSQIVNSSLRLVAFFGAPMAVGIALTAGNIVGLFHYPPGFGHASMLMRILAFHIPIVGIDMLLAIALAAKDRQVAWLVVGCIAAVFNPLANLVAIPLTRQHFGDGAIGAAIVTVATEVVMMVGAILLRPAGILDRGSVSFILRSVVASVTMIPAVLAVRGTPLAVQVVVGAATFGVAAVALRLVSLRSARDSAVQALRSSRQRRRLSPVPTGVEYR